MLFRIFTSLILLALLVYGGESSAQSPTSAAQGFTIFIKGDATLTSGRTDGAMAIGGNLTTNNYEINLVNANRAYYVQGASIGLAVGGAVKLNSGKLTVNGTNYVKIGNCSPGSSVGNDLKTWYRDQNGAQSTIFINDVSKGHGQDPSILINAQATSWTPNVSDDENPVCQNVFGTAQGQINMDESFEKLVTRSNQLAGLTDNVSIRDQNGNPINGATVGPYLDPTIFGPNPKIYFNPNALNVLTVSAEVWDTFSNFNVEGLSGGQYSSSFGIIVNIINVPGYIASKGTNTVKFPGFGGIGDNHGSYIIYNFPDATEKLTVGGERSIYGTLLAPKAQLTKGNASNIYGQVIAQTYEQNKEMVIYKPNLVSIPEPSITVTASSKCLSDAPYLDYSVALNNFNTTNLAKIEWLNSIDEVIYTMVNQPLSGSVLYPGAAVDAQGKGVAWPGWEMQGGQWVEVQDEFATLRDQGASIRITVNPTETVYVDYPQSEVGCKTDPNGTGSLPVTLSSFTARNENCSVALKWTVTEATDFSHFVVQRSKDAKNFVSLEKINYDPGKSEYSYYDSPFASESSEVSRNYYYRLQQVDTDNTFEYSTIRNVEAGQCDTRLAVDFYPNPTVDEVNVKSFSPVKMLEILTSGGKQVIKMSPVSNQTEFKVNVKNLNQGLYIVNIVNAEGKHSSKILKK